MVTSLAKILGLGEHENKFHPVAVKRYGEFVSKLQSVVDLTEITDEDMRAYLNDSDYKNFLDICEELVKWLAKNRLTKDFTVKNYTVSFPWTYGFESLLKKVSGRKMLQNYLEKAQSRAYQDRQRKDWEWQKAQAEHQLWVDQANKSLDILKANLSKNTIPEFQTPAWLKSYSPSVWVKQLSGPTKDWFTVNNNIPIAANKLTLEKALRNHIDVRYFYQAYYLPSVQYEAVSPPLVSVKGHLLRVKPGVPCLKWWLATYIISIAEFHLDEGTISDVRYGYELKGQCFPEKLGTVYSGPEFWKYQDAFITPISLLALLAWGKAELPGVEVLKRNSPWTVYAVEVFPGEITLHDDFIKFVRDMTKKTSLDKSLLSRGMCDEETALLVKAKLEKLQKPETPVAFIGIANGPESKTGNDYEMLVNALGKLGYNTAEATKTAKYVCQKSPHETLVDKIKIAVQYLNK